MTGAAAFARREWRFLAFVASTPTLLLSPSAFSVGLVAGVGGNLIAHALTEPFWRIASAIEAAPGVAMVIDHAEGVEIAAAREEKGG